MGPWPIFLPSHPRCTPWFSTSTSTTCSSGASPTAKPIWPDSTKPKARGELLNAGAFGDADSAVLVFAPGMEAVAEAFADGDPYVLADLVPSRRVTTWNVVT